MTAAEILTSYAAARRHMSSATWSALVALATEPNRWQTRADMAAKMPWLSTRTKNVQNWQSMLIPAVDLGAIQIRQGRRGRGPDGKPVPTRYRITAKGLSLLGL